MNEEIAIKLLKKYAPNEKLFRIILNHSKAVQKVALRFAKKTKGVNLELIKIGSLLHDIGRFYSNNIRHGIVGAKILRKENLPQYAKIAETHIGAGLTKEDIIKQNLDLPLKDYLPKTKEEKIIAHADNLIFGTEEKSFKEVIKRFKQFGIRYIERLIKLKNEVEKT